MDPDVISLKFLLWFFRSVQRYPVLRGCGGLVLRVEWWRRRQSDQYKGEAGHPQKGPAREVILKGRRAQKGRTDSPYVGFQVEQVEVVRLDQLPRLVPERVDLLGLCGLALEAVEARFERVDPREVGRHLQYSTVTAAGISLVMQ